MSPLSVPTTARLPSTLILGPGDPIVQRSISRLSRNSLIHLALDWLNSDSVSLTGPYLRHPKTQALQDGEDDTDDLFPAAENLADLRKLYADMQERKGARREVADRMLEGDWRHGLNLYQLATMDFQHLNDHPNSRKWSSFRIVRLGPSSVAEPQSSVTKATPLCMPRFHPSTFLQSLQNEILPDAKAHFHFDRPRNKRALLLRIFITDSPYHTSLALEPGDENEAAETSHTLLIAFPDSAPYLYLSKSSGSKPVLAGGVPLNLQKLVVEAIPKALSRPGERYALKSANQSARSLDTLLSTRGPGRTNQAGGGWSIYADESTPDTPLDTLLPPPDPHDASLGRGCRKRNFNGSSISTVKRTRVLARARFGTSSTCLDGKGLDRLDVTMQDAFASPKGMPDSKFTVADGAAGLKVANAAGHGVDEAFGDQSDLDGGTEKSLPGAWAPSIKLVFQGPHVFAGLRRLVESGIVDGETMPGWMTGEAGICVGSIKAGRIRANGLSAGL